MNPLERIRDYWQVDAETYDASPSHNPATPAERAAWTGAIERLLPTAPSSVLDVGAGTGFLSLPAARLGHTVTAVDLAPAMCERLIAKATREGLQVTVVETSADRLPEGPFDAVVTRHLLWTLPDPASALKAWRRACPDGRLVAFGASWGDTADSLETARAKARGLLRRVRRRPPAHHRDYEPELRAALPLAGGGSLDQLVDLVESSGWGTARLERLVEVELAGTQRLSGLERLLGVPPAYALTAG